MNEGKRLEPARRRFLQWLMLVPCAAVIAPDAVQAALASISNYYLHHKDTFIKAFDDTNQGAYQYLKVQLSEEKAGIITQGAAFEFRNILPTLPDVGGIDNDNTCYLIIAAWYLAYYRPMKELGLLADDVGFMIYELNRIDLKNMSERQAVQEGKAKFSPEAETRMKHWAENTQLRKYPENWVAEFIKGNGKNFDFGYNYTECGLCKFFHHHNTPELAPYVCLNDFLRSKRLNTGLHRTETLGQGDAVCNFRYKYGRPVTQTWDTEISLIRERVKSGRVCTVPS